MKIKLKKLHPDARLPEKSKEGDLCYDVWAVDEEEIAPNVWRYRLGFSYEIERDYLYALDINLRNLQKDVMDAFIVAFKDNAPSGCFRQISPATPW